MSDTKRYIIYLTDDEAKEFFAKKINIECITDIADVYHKNNHTISSLRYYNKNKEKINALRREKYLAQKEKNKSINTVIET